MLYQLRDVHRPRNSREASNLLRQVGNFPLYGQGASLIRTDPSTAQAVVDLSEVISDEWRMDGANLHVGSGVRLAQLAVDVPLLAEVINGDYPLTLRNSLTVGDALLEARSDSLLLGVLAGLTARIDTPERGNDDLIEIGRWCNLTLAERAGLLILGLIIPNFVDNPWRFAIEKVCRTPADAPIVAAIGFAYTRQPNPGSYCMVVGLGKGPRRYAAGMTSELDNYKGSATYRSEMAAVLSRRALAAAERLARRG